MNENSVVYKEKKEDTRAYIEIDKLGRVICINSVLSNLLSKTDAEVVGDYLNNILIPASSSGNTKAFHYVWQDIRRGKIQESKFILISRDKKAKTLKFEIQTDTNIYGEVNRITMVSEETNYLPKEKTDFDKDAEIAANKAEMVGMMSSLKSRQKEMISRMQQSRNLQKEMISNMQNLLNNTTNYTSF